MRPQLTTDIVLGAGCIVVSIAAIFLWIPIDTSTGLIETVRRQVSIGDALAPTTAFGFVLAGGTLLVLRGHRSAADRRITIGNLRFLFALLSMLAASLALMRWAGPVVASVTAEDGYRILRDTAPWKQIGFFLGGSVLVAGLISLVEGRITSRSVMIGTLAALAMILIYDLPFEDLLLPPNGDV